MPVVGAGKRTASPPRGRGTDRGTPPPHPHRKTSVFYVLSTRAAMPSTFALISSNPSFCWCSVLRSCSNNSLSGFFAGGLGALGSPLAVAIMLFAARRFYVPRMASEDKLLEDQFGDAWRNYAAKTPSRLLPFVV